MNKFQGTGVAMITPFLKDGGVDYAGLKKLINYLIEGGVDYLVSLGTTGETATLSTSEKHQIWEFTAEVNANRVPLVAGIGGNDTREIQNVMKQFDKLGYDAFLSVSPYYSKPNQEGIYQHYKALSEVSPLPIILYNVPGRTGSNMSPETTCRLAHDFNNIIGTKEASGSFDQFNLIMRDKPADFLLISGDDPIALPMLSIGAVGVISVLGNAYPKALSEIINLGLKGNYAEALPNHLRLLEITRLLFTEGNPVGIKATLAEMGICEANLRLPLVAPSAALVRQIKTEMENIADLVG
ncbi:MAG: 4-hydroxy-tetrahydrodipicolinate synthase [Pedobacter sp.]|nr:MAG: 4-hydroxy-tetrahydrodipicolinate synthase [Pedobacter sp.]